MKKTLLSIIFILFLNDSYGQQGTFTAVVWDSLLNGIQAYSVAPAFDGGYIIAGEAEFSSEGFILKIDSGGNVLWNKAVIDTNFYGDFQFNSVIATNDSCFLLAGTVVYGSYSNNVNGFCMKVNADGDTLWSTRIAQSGYDLYFTSLQQTYDSGYVMAGYAYANYNEYIYAAKIDLAGNLVWTTLLNETNTINDIGGSIKQTSDSGYLLIGNVENSATNVESAVLIKLSSSGAVAWAKAYRDTLRYGVSGNDVAVTNDGFICYISVSGTAALMKTDFSGNVLRTKAYNAGGIAYNNIAPKLHQTFDGGYAFVGASSLTRTDSSGNVLWEDYLRLEPTDVLQTKDKGFLNVGNGPLFGELRSGPPARPQIGIIKADSLGNVSNCILPNYAGNDTVVLRDSAIVFNAIAGGTSMTAHPTASHIALVTDTGCVLLTGGIDEVKFDNALFVYPNPSSAAFTVSVEKEIMNGQLTILNTFGEKVYTGRFNGKQSTISCTLSAGVYFIRITNNSGQWVGRFLKE